MEFQGVEQRPKIYHIGLCVYSDRVDGICQAMMKKASVYRETNAFDKEVNKKAVQVSDEIRPDIVFMQIQTPGIIHKQTLQHLKNNGAIVFNWTGDVRDSVPDWMISVSQEVTSTLFSNMRDVNQMRLQGYRSDFLEIGYDPEIFKPEGHIIPSRDIVYFGNNMDASRFPMSKFRIEMCNFLREKFGNRFGVYGSGPNSDGNFNYSQVDESAGYRSAKIAINCSHYEIQNYTSDRMHRILGTGVPICLAKWFPGIEDTYIDGVHLRIWRTLEELESLCNYYLNPENESERIKIASQGHFLALKELTYESMINNILKLYYEYKA